MPYKEKTKDREWHREHMRQKRKGVTVGVTHTAKMGFEPKPQYEVDADGNRIYE